MRKTAAEYQRAYRDRLRAAAIEARKVTPGSAADDSSDYLRQPINELVQWSFDFEDPLEGLGYRCLASFDEAAPTYDPGESSISFSGRPTLERLTGLAGVFLDAALELHQFIHNYKIGEIEDRIVELSQDAKVDPKLKALAIARLNDIRAGLNREFRRSFPEISVKGTTST